MKLGIVISTYYRKDNNTKFYLTRALDSVFNQTNQNFKVFLIGDRYENEKEINEIVGKYDLKKLFFVNLKEAKERDKYEDKNLIWSYGGVNALNIGIDLALEDGYRYICHLDHDDWWSENHLQEIIECINKFKTNFICTKSTYMNETNFLPMIETNKKYEEFQPKSSGLIHSSTCINFKEIPLRYRDIYAETGEIGLPADADLWERIRVYLTTKNEKSIYINELTCFHEEEGFSKKN